VLLDIVTVIHEKGRNIMQGKIIITTDNRNVYRMIKEMNTVNYYA
jgi:hypothetical protein